MVTEVKPLDRNEEKYMEIIVGGIIEKNGKFLLVQEAKEKCFGKWNFPAGHLECNELLIEGAKREIVEECGCNVEINGILKIGNIVKNNSNIILIAFSTNLLEENVSFDKREILDVKWFSYEQILDMKEQLRDYDWIVSVITAFVNRKIINIDVINVLLS